MKSLYPNLIQLPPQLRIANCELRIVQNGVFVGLPITLPSRALCGTNAQQDSKLLFVPSLKSSVFTKIQNRLFHKNGLLKSFGQSPKENYETDVAF